MSHYQRALAATRHRSAREHLGEVITVGKPAKAEHLLAELENLCLIPVRVRRPQAGHCGLQELAAR
jgi:hypothetical protein